MLCASTDVIVTVPPVPNTASSPLVHVAFAPPVAAVSQFAVVVFHVPLPPLALAFVSVPSQNRLCAHAGCANPSSSATIDASVPRRTGMHRAALPRASPFANSDATTQVDVAVDQTMR